MKHICPVCGYDELSEPAYDEYGTPSYEICLSCGFEFGFDDDSEGYTLEQWREKWIKKGMKWGAKYSPPIKLEPCQATAKCGYGHKIMKHICPVCGYY